MILPLRDLIAAQKHKSYRYGYSGLVLVVKGHEELFFEFASRSRRDHLRDFLEVRAERARQDLREGKTPPVSEEAERAKKLRELELSPTESRGPRPSQHEDTPPVMFQSSSSSGLVTFKPQESLRFTCLTIGQLY